MAEDWDSVVAHGRRRPSERALCSAIAGLGLMGTEPERSAELLTFAWRAGFDSAHGDIGRILVDGVHLQIAPGVLAVLPLDRRTVAIALAEVQHHRGYIEEAIDVLEGLDVDTLVALALVQCYLAVDDLASVIALTESIQNQDDATALLCTFRSAALRANGDVEKALICAREACQYDDRSPEVLKMARFELAMGLRASGATDEFRRQLDLILNDDPDDDFVATLRGAGASEIQVFEEEEVGRLRAEIESAELALGAAEEKLTRLQIEIDQVQYEHDQRIVPLLAMLDSLNADISALQARYNPEDAEAGRACEHATAEASKSADAARQVTNRAAPPVPPDSAGLRSLYREAARSLHPDLSLEEADREERTAAMAEVNEAYAKGDVVRLQEVLDRWAVRQQVPRPATLADQVPILRKRLTLLQRRIVHVGQRVQALRNSPSGQLLADVHRAAGEGRDLLGELEERLMARTAKAVATLNRLRDRDDPSPDAPGSGPSQ